MGPRSRSPAVSPSAPTASTDTPPAAADLAALKADLAEVRALLLALPETLAGGPRPAPPLLDLAGAARRLNVSERTVESLVAVGELAVIRIGTGRGVRRFDPDAVDALIRRQARTL